MFSIHLKLSLPDKLLWMCLWVLPLHRRSSPGHVVMLLDGAEWTTLLIYTSDKQSVNMVN